MTNAPDGAFTPAEGDAILDMTEWASAYRDLRWVIPSMPWRHDSLAGLPVERTNFPGRLDLIGRRSRFAEPCVLCTLYRTPDGPEIVGMPEPVAAMPVEAHRPSPLRGIDLRRIPAPRFSLALAGGGALVVSGVLAGIAPVVATAATSTVQPASMPGPMPDPGPSGWGAGGGHPAIAPVQVTPDGEGDDGFNPPPGCVTVPDDPCPPDLLSPYDTTIDPLESPAAGDLAYDKSNAKTNSVFDGSDPDGPMYVLEMRKEVKEAEAPAEAAESVDDEAQERAAAEVVDDAVDRGEEWIEEQDDSAAEVAAVTPIEAAPEPAPEPVPMPLSEPVEPPVTEAPPAPAAPLPIEAAEVAPVESEVTPERPAGVQDPADLREAAGHYRTAADLLEQAADEIEAGDAALAGESDPEESTGQGGSADTDTVEDETLAGADVDSVDGNDADRVEIDISDLKVTVNGEAVAVELGGTIGVEVDDTEVSDVDTARGDATEAPAAA